VPVFFSDQAHLFGEASHPITLFAGNWSSWPQNFPVGTWQPLCGRCTPVQRGGAVQVFSWWRLGPGWRFRRCQRDRRVGIAPPINWKGEPAALFYRGTFCMKPGNGTPWLYGGGGIELLAKGYADGLCAPWRAAIGCRCRAGSTKR